MQIVGQPSWRFGEGDAGDLHFALFARDAAGLAAPAAPDIPPPLSVAIARRLQAPDVTTDQWVTWWRRLVSFQAAEAAPARRLGPDQDMIAWLRATAERHTAVFDPPGFASLVSMPELRALASAAFATDGRPWLGGEPRPAEFGYSVVRAAAEAAAAEFGVSPGKIDGTVHVLDVQGAWSCLAGPGYALCSRAAAADPQVAARLLRAVFASRLTGSEPG